MTVIKQQFRSGDVVRYIPMGDKEYVLESINNKNYPLSIKDLGIFTLGGKQDRGHTHPLLILIRRPEEKKKLYQVFYKYNDEEMPRTAGCLYNSEEDYYTRGIPKDKIEWIELKFVCER